MAKTTIYHNPRCSKSRQALALLREHNIEPDIVEYLKTPPSQAELKRLLKLLGTEPQDIMRKNEAVYKELGLSNETSKAALVKAIAEHPILLERPIVVHDQQAVIGRPPENVLALL